ncbi:MAG TPA: DNA-processing protein DprA [Actinomycetota bacterium]|nr:DNA-processing protein DprA [Actinomycetota bacterium]
MSVREEQRDLLALCAIPNVNWSLLAREAQRPGGLARLWRAEVTEKTDQARTASELLAVALANPRNLTRRVDDEVRQLPGGVRLCTVLDDEYPSNLRLIANLPPFLFYLGELRGSDAFSVAVVGTRTPSALGVQEADRLSRELAGRDVTVLSGLALGIDTAAHRGTLAARGRTIAVVGTGIRTCYPKENAGLASDIVSSGGAVVSQFWPSAPPTKSSFPMRNVVSSGMSQGTVVIEATGMSGARNQARRALEQGKKAFLLRDRVTSQQWARRYLERGAIEVSTVDEILPLLRAPEVIEHLSDRRRQLALELA